MFFPKSSDGGSAGFNAPKPSPPDSDARYGGLEGLSEAQKELIQKRSEAFHNRTHNHERLVYNVHEPIPLMDPVGVLLFSSEFESGNLERAYQVTATEYDLELASDANARGSTQWFNFSITNAQPAVYTFNLVNFVKPTSLYNKGLHPCFYSRKTKRWAAVGQNVCYFKNRLPKRDRNSQSCDLFAMSFELELSDPKDVYYLAYCYPFTYTDLQIYLRSLEEASKRQNLYKFKRDILCTTVQGRRCDIVKISKKVKKPPKNGEKTEKKYIVISGRVHPGETNASWVVKGMLDFLTSNKVWSLDLLDQYKFVFIPMLNPDGVAIGNYRCDTNGYDLNRCWKSPSDVLHPTIYHTKNCIRKLTGKGEVCVFFDIHGHSRKRNVFAYGNACTRRYRMKSAPKYPHCEKILPLMMSKLCSEFSFDECTFHVTKKKEGTARVVNWAEMGVALSYTIESSFLGTSGMSAEANNYTINQYQELGMMLLRAVHEFSSPNQAFVQSCVAELSAMYSTRERDSAGSETPFTALLSSLQLTAGNQSKTVSERVRAMSLKQQGDCFAAFFLENEHRSAAQRRQEQQRQKNAHITAAASEDAASPTVTPADSPETPSADGESDDEAETQSDTGSVHTPRRYSVSREMTSGSGYRYAAEGRQRHLRKGSAPGSPASAAEYDDESLEAESNEEEEEEELSEACKAGEDELGQPLPSQGQEKYRAGVAEGAEAGGGLGAGSPEPPTGEESDEEEEEMAEDEDDLADDEEDALPADLPGVSQPHNPVSLTVTESETFASSLFSHTVVVSRDFGGPDSTAPEESAPTHPATTRHPSTGEPSEQDASDATPASSADEADAGPSWPATADVSEGSAATAPAGGADAPEEEDEEEEVVVVVAPGVPEAEGVAEVAGEGEGEEEEEEGGVPVLPAGGGGGGGGGGQQEVAAADPAEEGGTGSASDGGGGSACHTPTAAECATTAAAPTAEPASGTPNTTSTGGVPDGDGLPEGSVATGYPENPGTPPEPRADCEEEQEDDACDRVKVDGGEDEEEGEEGKGGGGGGGVALPPCGAVGAAAAAPQQQQQGGGEGGVEEPSIAAIVCKINELTEQHERARRMDVPGGGTFSSRHHHHHQQQQQQQKQRPHSSGSTGRVSSAAQRGGSGERAAPSRVHSAGSSACTDSGDDLSLSPEALSRCSGERRNAPLAPLSNNANYTAGRAEGGSPSRAQQQESDGGRFGSPPGKVSRFSGYHTQSSVEVVASAEAEGGAVGEAGEGDTEQLTQLMVQNIRQIQILAVQQREQKGDAGGTAGCEKDDSLAMHAVSVTDEYSVMYQAVEEDEEDDDDDDDDPNGNESSEEKAAAEGGEVEGKAAADRRISGGGKRKRRKGRKKRKRGLVSTLQLRVSSGRAYCQDIDEGEGGAGRYAARADARRRASNRSSSVDATAALQRNMSLTNARVVQALPHPPVRIRAASLGLSGGRAALRSQVCNLLGVVNRSAVVNMDLREMG